MAGSVDDVDKGYITRKELEENSPSRRDGISLKKENQLRNKCIRFIVENGKKFKIQQSVIATANVFCHRFFLQRSHAKHEWYRIAIACLFLASKVVEQQIALATFRREGWRETLKEVFKKEIPFEELEKMIVDDEREILHAINFEFFVDHPYKYFVDVIKTIKDVPAEVCQAATEFMDDSYFSSLCLQFKPQKIAGAAFHLAHKFLKIKLPFQEEEGYREFFQMTPNELEDISSQMLDLYEYRPPPQTAPDNQSAPSSSLSGNQSLSVSASTSAPSSLPAPHGNQSSQPPAEPSKQSLTVLTPRPPRPGNESLTKLMPPPPAPGKQSVPEDTAPDNQSASSSSSSSLPGEQSLSESAPRPLPAAHGNQSPPPPAVPSSSK